MILSFMSAVEFACILYSFETLFSVITCTVSITDDILSHVKYTPEYREMGENERMMTKWHLNYVSFMII